MLYWPQPLPSYPLHGFFYVAGGKTGRHNGNWGMQGKMRRGAL